jgi:hypothetical protein
LLVNNVDSVETCGAEHLVHLISRGQDIMRHRSAGVMMMSGKFPASQKMDNMERRARQENSRHLRYNPLGMGKMSEGSERDRQVKIPGLKRELLDIGVNGEAVPEGEILKRLMRHARGKIDPDHHSAVADPTSNNIEEHPCAASEVNHPVALFQIEGIDQESEEFEVFGGEIFVPVIGERLKIFSTVIH